MTTYNDEEILIENERRKNKLFPHYNPVTGEGSLESRFAFRINEKTIVYLPEEMKSIKLIGNAVSCGGLDMYFVNNGTSESQKVKIMKAIFSAREKFDFEFWAYKKCRIKDKETRQIKPFLLRPAQRKTLHELERQRKEGIPIRIIIDKARQWGGSTLVQMYMMWIQLKWKQNWNSAIATQFISQANNIKAMYETAINEYPYNEYTLKNANSVGTVKKIEQTGSMIYIGSLQNPDSLRSGDYSMAHFSEVGLWQKTEKINPIDFVSSISGSILSAPYTVIVLESTAKGQGNYFHQEWLKALRGESGFTAVFVAWWEIEMYRKPFADDNEAIRFYHELNEYGRFLWSLGATLEGINWYFSHKKKQSLRDSQMFEEFPSTAEESFISSGERVFPFEYVRKAEKTVREPIFVGDIIADGKKGKEAFANIRFEENDKFGCLKIWEYPEKKGMRNRYVVSMDVGGVSKGADFTVIRVIDRYWRTDGGVDEFVATWRGHYDVDLAVWKAVQLAYAYDNAMLVIESNTIDSKFQHTDGDHSFTVFDEIAPYYSNLYTRQDPQRIKEGLPPKFGFFTGTGAERGKTALIDNYIAVLREGQIIEHDQEAINELDYYEYKENNKMGAKEGCHDDVVMASAIGLFVSKTMDLPVTEITQSYFPSNSYL